MKALTVRQPWAELIVAGDKDVENREWQTPHRGLLAIHAGRSTIELRRLGLHPADYVLGAVVGVVELVDVVRDHSSRWARQGHWHWVLTRPHGIVPALPARGALHLFEVDVPGWQQQPLQRSDLGL